MRHLLSLEALPRGVPLYIFGASQGGAVLRAAVEQAWPGCQAGFIDDTKTGTFMGMPILSSTQFAGLAESGAEVLIASQHWRKIGRMLHGLGVTRLWDASPVVRRMLRTFRGRVIAPFRPDDDAVLDQAVRAATGMGTDELVARLTSSSLVERLGQRLAPGGGQVPVYIAGTGRAAKALRAGLEAECHAAARVQPVGMIDGFDGFMDVLDVCSVETFLAEPWSAEGVVLLPSPEAGEVARRLAAAPVRVVDVSDLLPDVAPAAEFVAAGECARPLSFHPLVSAIVAGDGGGEQSYDRIETVSWDGSAHTLPAAVARCRGEVIALRRPGDRWLPHAVAAGVALLRDHPGVVAVAGHGGTDFIDYAFGDREVRFSAALFRREAMAALPSPVQGACGADWEFLLWGRLLLTGCVRFDPSLAEAAPGAVQRPDMVTALRARAAAVSSLFGAAGGVLPDARLWQQCLVRQFARFHNAALANGRAAEFGDFLGGLPHGLAPLDAPPIPWRVFYKAAEDLARAGRTGAARQLRSASGSYEAWLS